MSHVVADVVPYLLCERNFPVECPEPSHPGTGHLFMEKPAAEAIDKEVEEEEQTE